MLEYKPLLKWNKKIKLGNRKFINIIGGLAMKVIKMIIMFFMLLTFITACNTIEQGEDVSVRNDDRARNMAAVPNDDRNNNFDKVQNVSYRNQNNERKDENRMQVAKEAQNKIENLDEVRQANVIVANRNAYVAVVLDHQPKGEVGNKVKDKISNQVKATDKNIRNVFVSSNPDFIDRMEDFGDKLQSGKPVKGLFEEFNETIQRVFPQAR